MIGLEQGQISAISRLFSSSVIHEMARRGRSPLFARLVRDSMAFGPVAPSDQVYNLFDQAFSILKRRANRHEYVYKAALTHKVLLGVHSLQTASMLTEFRVGDCKADLVILNGTGTVYEIKSERDSLSRLERQVNAYRSVFAKVSVIAGSNHVDEVFARVPPDVGVLILDSRYRITTLRDALDQPDRTDPSVIFDSIRLAEAAQVLQRNGISIPKVSNTEMYAALRARFVALAPRAAHQGMVQVLRKSRNLMPLTGLIAGLPASLRPAALSTPMRKTDHGRLLSAVNTRLLDAVNWA